MLPTNKTYHLPGWLKTLVMCLVLFGFVWGALYSFLMRKVQIAGQERKEVSCQMSGFI